MPDKDQPTKPDHPKPREHPIKNPAPIIPVKPSELIKKGKDNEGGNHIKKS